MSFQEAVQRDLNNVFFNAVEFATVHDIDGVSYSVVVDSDSLLKRQLKLNREAGVYDGDVLFFIRAGILPKEPAPGHVMRFDGKVYRVVNAQNTDGMLSVTLKGTRA